MVGSWNENVWRVNNIPDQDKRDVEGGMCGRAKENVWKGDSLGKVNIR